MPKILHLTLKKKWFDMIASGEKKEEYREVKPYWINRLTWHEYHTYGQIELIHALQTKDCIRRDFDIVVFRNGYSKKAKVVQVELLSIKYKTPDNPEWLDDNPKNWYFCIQLGKILYKSHTN